MGKRTDETTTKELALVSSLILNLDVLGGTIWQTFDRAYEIASAFVLACPPQEYDNKWGDEMGDYEETIQEFVSNYLEKNYTYEYNKYERNLRSCHEHG